MADISNTKVRKIQQLRRILFVGPTGVGKSTLINILINNNVTGESMSKPAGTGDTSSGQTAFFVTYYDFPNNAYTDSVGLGDNRFKAEDVMNSLKSVLKYCSIGYNKIFICIQYGRISTETRRYIDLLTTIFGQDVLKWCSIIFTGCNDQKMTKEKYLEKNKEDANIVEIINQVKTVLFGDNMTDQDRDMEAVLRQRRQAFLNRIIEDINETANTEYFKLKTEDFFERIMKIIRLIFNRTTEAAFSATADIKNLAKAVVVSMQSSKYANYFGACSICTEDVTDENHPIITKCNHVYHKVCLEKWVNGKSDKHCPNCRMTFDNDQTSFYTNLIYDT